ncbi:PAS domain S-box protein [Aquabacterium soli]|uniref:histidine kinase n=1 Tax=Aquabacterium soli TaxID=2493092 RepID=A0A426V9R4_9BURK|nr:ATP-binding protein [Aquabacterium soli]RRS03676.1 PAS domain S-box protein [Aquabacterium soli]
MSSTAGSPQPPTADDIATLRAELEAARAEADRYRASFELSASGQVLSTLDGRMTLVNDRGCAILGHRREALLGRHFSEITHPDDLATNTALLEQLRIGLLPSLRLDKRYIRADGTAVWCAIHVAVIRDTAGRPTALLAVINDISERKRIEAELRERNDVLAGLSAHMPSALFIYKVDQQGHRSLPYLSESMSTMFELDLPTLRQDATLLAQRIHPDDVHRLGAEADESHRTLEPIQQEYRVLLPSRGLRWVAARSMPHRMPDGSTQWYGVMTDITEQKLYQEALVNAQAADRANQAKSDFLSRMSHELRTPLNAVIGFAQLLRMDTQRALDEEQRRRVGLIEEAGAHLQAVINDVLDLSRIEVGSLPLSIESLNLRALTDEALNMVEESAHAAAVRLLPLEVAADLYVRGDRVRLRQVLVNLLSNAIKYNRQGGTVQIKARAQGSEVHLDVTDNGIGMSEEQQQHLFEPFNRLGVESSGVDGTGIGLVIVRKLLELMEGGIKVTSHKGRGTTVCISLASALPAAPDLPAARASEDEPAAAPLRTGTLLYAEDNDVNVMLVEQILALRPEWTLLVAVSGRQALALAHETHPDLLLLDMHLGDMTGFEVVNELDKDDRLSRIPRVALSADAMPDQIHAAKARGFEAYLTKPLDVSNLLDCLDEHMRRLGG